MLVASVGARRTSQTISPGASTVTQKRQCTVQSIRIDSVAFPVIAAPKSGGRTDLPARSHGTSNDPSDRDATPRYMRPRATTLQNAGERERARGERPPDDRLTGEPVATAIGNGELADTAPSRLNSTICGPPFKGTPGLEGC